MNATTTVQTSGTTTESAKALVRQLFDAELSLSRKATLLRTQIEDDGAARSLDLLRGEMGESIDRAAARDDLSREFLATRRAIQHAREQRAEAIVQVRLAEAEAVAAGVAPVLEELAELQEAMRPHLEALQALTDAEWIPNVQLQLVVDRYVAMGGKAVPRHQRLAQEAELIAARAAQMRQQAARRNDGGSISAASAEEIIDAVASDPMRIAPSHDAIEEWVAQATAAATKRASELSLGAHGGLRFHLRWAGGEINEAQSRVEILTPPSAMTLA